MTGVFILPHFMCYTSLRGGISLCLELWVYCCPSQWQPSDHLARVHSEGKTKQFSSVGLIYDKGTFITQAGMVAREGVFWHRVKSDRYCLWLLCEWWCTESHNWKYTNKNHIWALCFLNWIHLHVTSTIFTIICTIFSLIFFLKLTHCCFYSSLF